MPGNKEGEDSVFQQFQTPGGYGYYSSSVTSFSILTIFFSSFNQNLDFSKKVAKNSGLQVNSWPRNYPLFALTEQTGTIPYSQFLSLPLHHHTPPCQRLTPWRWYSLGPSAVSGYPEKALPCEMDCASPIINACQSVIDQRALYVHFSFDSVVAHLPLMLFSYSLAHLELDKYFYILYLWRFLREDGGVG